MLANLFSPRPSATSSAWMRGYDSRFFESLGTPWAQSDAGIGVSPQVALTIGVVYRAVNVLAHAVATVPLVIMRETEDGEKERARAHPQYRLLHDEANGWTTSFRFRHLCVVRMLLWGNFYAELLPGYYGPAQMVPLDPNGTRVADQLGDGRLVYVTPGKRPGERERTLMQEEVLHVRGMSLDGKSGIPLTTFARNAMGLALAAEKHGSLFMRRGAQFSGILTTEKPMSPTERAANEKAWNEARGGIAGSGGVPLLEGGMKFDQTSSTNRDSQWTEARDFQIAELGPRYLGVPGLLCGYPDKTATYASAQEMRQVFVDTGVTPITDSIAAEMTRSVVTGTREGYYASFLLEGLLKGDLKTRYEAHRTAIMTGWKSRNEVRRIEGDNPGPPELDEFFEPLNLGKTGDDGTETPPRSPQRKREPDDSEDADDDQDAVAVAPIAPAVPSAAEARLRELGAAEARRLLRREVSAIVGSGAQKGAARRYAADPSGWRAWLAEFYGGHAANVSDGLCVPYGVAKAYCDEQQARLMESVAAVERFEAEALPRLMAMIGGA